MQDTTAANITATLEQVRPRLKRLRTQRRMTLIGVAAATGISKSTLSRLETWKIVIPTSKVTPEARAHDGHDGHDGHEWIYVLTGHMRFVLGDRDLVLAPGDVASFDTAVPHWYGSTGDEPAEIVSIFGRPGERMTVRTTPP